MAIIIQNVSDTHAPFGEHEYEVRINQKAIVRFLHRREEGLTVCLRRAAKAIERAKWEKAQGEYEQLAADATARKKEAL